MASGGDKTSDRKKKNMHTLRTAQKCPRYLHMAGCASTDLGTVGDVANKSAALHTGNFPCWEVRGRKGKR